MKILKQYSDKIEIAKKHIGAGKDPEKRKPIPPNDIKYLYEKKAQCPICGIKLSVGKSNTEHIFPLGFGGTNSDENMICICKQCNSAQNEVMMLLVGPEYKDEFPENIEKIKDYIYWSEITIDYGIDFSKNLFPDLFDIFCDARYLDSTQFNEPINAYGRYSTWKQEDEPNYIKNLKKGGTFYQKIKIKTEKKNSTKWSLWKNIMVPLGDKIFGIQEPKSKSKPEPKSKSKPEPKSKRELIKLLEGNKIEDFCSLIISLIGDEGISSSNLGIKIRKHQEEHNWDVLGIKSLFSRFGITYFIDENDQKRKITLTQAIELYLKDEVEILGEKPNLKYKLIKSLNDNREVLKKGSKEEFSDLIISLIGKETISSTEFASKIKQYQIENSWEKTGKRPFLSHFSFNSGKTYKQILESHMSDKVEILGEQPNYQFRLKDN
mgnify:CR=1 FL=1